MSITPTPEQQAIIDAFVAGHNLVVQAGAGSGKTSTLQLLAEAVPTKHGHYIAFNRSIADEAKRRFPRTVQARTAHSLALREVGGRFRPRLGRAREPFSVTLEALRPQQMSFRTPTGYRSLSEYQIAKHAVDTVKVFCMSADHGLSAAHVPPVPGLDPLGPNGPVLGDNHERLVDQVLPLAQRAWADLGRTDGVLKFEHQHYLKMWQLTGPTIGGDYLLFDEAQDASPVIADVVNRQDHLRRVMVGDSAQAIYGWAGALDAMRAFSARPGVQTLTLSQSFRFGPTVAAAANTLLGQLRAPLRLTGTDRIASSIRRLDGPDAPAADAVLCRTNAGMLAELITAQAQKREVGVVGGVDDLRRFVEGARDLQSSNRSNHPDLVAFRSWPDVVAYVDTDPSGSDLKLMVDLIEDMGVATLMTVLTKCVPEEFADVVASTAHKAKGREWDAVRISADFEIGEDMEPEARRAELMLAYVAVTRAKRLLDPGLLGSLLGDLAKIGPSGTVVTPVASAAAVTSPGTGGVTVEPVLQRPAAETAAGSAAETVPEADRTLVLDEPLWEMVTRFAAAQDRDPHEVALRCIRLMMEAATSA